VKIVVPGYAREQRPGCRKEEIMRLAVILVVLLAAPALFIGLAAAGEKSGCMVKKVATCMPGMEKSSAASEEKGMMGKMKEGGETAVQKTKEGGETVIEKTKEGGKAIYEKAKDIMPGGKDKP